MISYRPERIIIEETVRDSPIVSTVLDRLSGVPLETVSTSDTLLDDLQQRRPSIPRAKKTLVLTSHKGRFFKRCPARQVRGQAGNACCNYFVVNFASNCHMECSYCYLQSYLNFPYMVIYANVTDLLNELDQVLAGNPEKRFRIGTGELADSLALDPITSYARHLVEFFSSRPNAVLELKTKSDCVEGILGLEHAERTVVSWSLNPPFIQESEEHKTAPIDRRLNAAEACVRAGYPVAFHLDPLVHYPAWETDYRSLIEEIFERIPASKIAWISLGTLRLTRAMLKQMKRRFPNSLLSVGELVPSPDQKLRYFRPIRIEMYRTLIRDIRRHSATTPLYTCMERADTWERTFGSPPPSEKTLGDSLVQIADRI